MQSALKRILGLSLGWIWRASSRKVILIYHALGTSNLAVQVARFQEQIDWLATNANVVPLNQLLTQETPQSLQVSITFDDGYGSVLDAALPILQRYGMVATVYVNPGCISEAVRTVSDPARGHYPTESFMTWGDLTKLRDAGWSIGGHGVDHIDLTLQDPQVVRFQVKECKAQIEAALKVPCTHFAYTWGRHSPFVRTAVREAGHTSAAAGLHGPVVHESDVFALPRVDIRAEYSLGDFKNIVRGSWDFLSLVQRWRGR
jgi:peptidoglycan/xylan/chitin deacetylase (PgdA/CDA1 family)